MTNTALILNSTSQSGQKIQKTITDVNTAAQADKLKTWAQGLNALTTNTQVGITKVVTTDLLNGGGDTSTKLPRNIKFYKGNDFDTKTEATSLTRADIKHQSSVENPPFFFVTYDGGGEFYLNFQKDAGSEYTLYISQLNPVSATSFDQEMEILTWETGDNIPTGTLKFMVPESETYQAATLTIPVTAE